MDLETILQTCFTKQQALRKLEELMDLKKKKIYTDEVKKMEPLIIFTAIPLPQEQISVLGNFVRKTFPQIKLIDLKVDPNLIGRSSLGWKGEYRDYSLRNKIVWK